MAADNLRALIERERPGESVREITAAAGVTESRLGYWLRPSTDLSRMPTMTQIHEIARIISCAPGKVYRAIRADVDGEMVLHDELTSDERSLLAAWRQLDDEGRRHALVSVTLPVPERTLLSAFRRLDEANQRKLLQIALVLDTDG